MKFKRYIASTKKRFSKKYILPIALITIVVALASYSTLAWVVSNSAAIENKFKLQTADVSIVEEFDGEVKENVYVENTAEATMYVRIALVEQITNADGSIAPKTSTDYFTYTGLPSEKWIEIGEYYYYTEQLKANGKTSSLFTSAIQNPNLVLADGQELSLTVMTEAIQVNGISEWNVTVDADGKITGGAN